MKNLVLLQKTRRFSCSQVNSRHKCLHVATTFFTVVFSPTSCLSSILYYRQLQNFFDYLSSRTVSLVGVRCAIAQNCPNTSESSLRRKGRTTVILKTGRFDNIEVQL